jgi:hypothetical protein
VNSIRLDEELFSLPNLPQLFRIHDLRFVRTLFNPSVFLLRFEKTAIFAVTKQKKLHNIESG